MTRLEYGLWLADQAAGGLLYAWPISALIVLAIVYSFWSAPRASRRRLAVVFLLCQSLFLFPVAHLLLGALLQVPSQRQGLSSPEATTVLQVLQVGQLGLAAVLVWMAGRGLRARALACTLPPIWYSLWTWMGAVMAVTGDWL